jgi:O-antigen/teichoic acid export membrane protein
MGEVFFGMWSILNAILLFSGVGTLGMTSVVNKFASEAGNYALNVDDILSTGTLILVPMATITSGILISISGWVADNISVQPVVQLQFNQALLITAISLFPQFIGRIPYGYFLSQLKNEVARLIDLLTNMGLWIGGVTIAFFVKDLVLIAAWGLFVQIASMIALFLLLNNSYKWHWHFSYVTFRRMLNFSAFTFIESLAVLLFQQFDRILVGITLGPVAAGVYSVSTSVGGRLSTITGQATDVMIPYASRKMSLLDHEKFYEVFRKLSKAVELLVSIIGTILVIWMNVILSIWISPNYAASYADIFRIIVIAYAILSLSRSGHQTLTGVGRVKFTSMTYLITSIAMLSSVYILSKHFGLIGAAVANFCIVGLLIFNLSVYSRYGKLSRWRDAVSGLSLGITLPIFSFLIVYWTNLLIVHLLFTIGVVIFVGIKVVQDEFLLANISLVLKKIRSPMSLKPTPKDIEH